jgi:hypothetical protein
MSTQVLVRPQIVFYFALAVGIVLPLPAIGDDAGVRSKAGSSTAETPLSRKRLRSNVILPSAELWGRSMNLWL